MMNNFKDDCIIAALVCLNGAAIALGVSSLVIGTKGMINIIKPIVKG